MIHTVQLRQRSSFGGVVADLQSNAAVSARMLGGIGTGDRSLNASST